MKNRFKMIPAVHLFLVKNDEILLLKRHNTGYEDGNYSFIAGHPEGKETLSESMIREAYEEAGIIISKDNLIFESVMHRNAKDSERIDFFYICKDWEGKLYNKEPDKCSELKWFKLNDLPNNIIPYILKAIENYNNNIKYDEFNF